MFKCVGVCVGVNLWTSSKRWTIYLWSTACSLAENEIKTVTNEKGRFDIFIYWHSVLIQFWVDLFRTVVIRLWPINTHTCSFFLLTIHGDNDNETKQKWKCIDD